MRLFIDLIWQLETLLSYGLNLSQGTLPLNIFRDHLYTIITIITIKTMQDAHHFHLIIGAAKLIQKTNKRINSAALE